jgi:hypothetical protein
MKYLSYILLGCLAIFLISCDFAPSSKRAVDGYYFEKETFTRTNFPVEIVLVQSRAQMQQEILKQMKKHPVSGKVEPKDVAAFSIISLNDNKCTIYMLDPKVQYEPEFIGHELVHCIYGEWHREPQG